MSQLERLISVYKDNREKVALEWKRRGEVVIGYLDSYLPEEMIHAAGFLPWKVVGTMKGSIPLSSVYRPKYTSLHCAHVLENFLNKDLHFLDGMVMSDWDDDHTRLWDQLRLVVKINFCPLLHVPQIKTPKALNYFMASLNQLKTMIEEHFGVSISDDDLRRSIKIYNETRRLLTKLSDLRRTNPGLLKGSDVFRIVDLSTIMPKEKFNPELQRVLDELNEAIKTDECHGNGKESKPALLLTSDWLDDISLVDLIEASGGNIIMDDMNNGTRYFSGEVDSGENPIKDLAYRYLTKSACPRMAFWPEQVNQMVQWVSENNIEGIINFPEIYSWPRRIYTPYIQARCEQAGVPITTILREYQLGRKGQIQTRLEAFLETIGKN